MPTIEFNRLLDTVVNHEATDLFVVPGAPPTLRMNGRLRRLELPDVSTDDIAKWIVSLWSREEARQVLERGEGLLGFAFGDRGRFRVSVARGTAGLDLTFRYRPPPPELEALGMPPIVRSLLRRPRGVILCAGSHRSGKSTVAAAMTEYVSAHFDRRIAIIQPVAEYDCKGRASLVVQFDTGSGPLEQLKALQQIPRSGSELAFVDDAMPEAILEVFTHAERGCLLIAVLQIRGAAAAIERACMAVEKELSAAGRKLVASQLIAVTSLELCRGIPDRPVMAREFLVVTPGLCGIIARGEFDRIDDAIATGARYGMELLDDHLFRLVRQRAIAAEEAIDHARYPTALSERIERRDSDDDGTDGAGVPARLPPDFGGSAASAQLPRE